MIPLNEIKLNQEVYKLINNKVEKLKIVRITTQIYIEDCKNDKLSDYYISAVKIDDFDKILNKEKYYQSYIMNDIDLNTLFKTKQELLDSL